MPFAAAPKIPKSTSFFVCSFMGGEIFYNMSAKNEMLKMHDCIWNAYLRIPFFFFRYDYKIILPSFSK